MYDYSRDEHRAQERTYITRYRLEKKDPTAAISEPVKPIVYYVDPATPTKWVPYVKKGIEDWQPAFEAAGFRNAIVAREAPKDDPDWSAEDARYSVVRWLPSTTENASGPNVHDPRSGEILEADIQFYHNVQNLQKNWYFVQVGAARSARAEAAAPRRSDGRTAALRRGSRSGTHARPSAQHESQLDLHAGADSRQELPAVSTGTRRRSWTTRASTTSRSPRMAFPWRISFRKSASTTSGQFIGAMLRFRSADVRRGTGAAEQVGERAGFQAAVSASRPRAPAASDPGDNTEAVGDIDAVRATALGFKNLQRVADMLLTATTGKQGDPYDELTEVYGRLIGQWTTEMNHVTQLVGGFLSQQKHIGQTGVRFTSVPKARQAEAVKFLLDNAFQTPQFMIRPDILRLIQPTGAIARVRTAQNSVMNSLLQTARLDRLIEQAAIDGAAAYTPVQFLADVRSGIWSELRTPAAPIDPYRRNTQRVYLDTIDNRLNGGAEPSAEVRALLKGELRTLRGQLVAAIPAATDRATRLHLEDSRDTIDEILDPRAMRTRTARGGWGRRRSARLRGLPSCPGFSSSRFDYENDPFLQRPTSCWPDYVIR